MLKKIVIFLAFFSLTFANEIDLSLHENSLYSQNGEDGVLTEIFKWIEPSSKFCVEFGGDDGVTNSNTYLFRLQGWEGLLLDRMHDISEHNLHQEFITAENINTLFEKYQVPANLDLLSIDIDYNDFYVWKALDAKYQPAVVVIEYNASLPPTEDKVVHYHPFFCGGGTNYFGASILAMFNLGRSKGYSLVYAEKNGVNLFFIRDDILLTKNLKFKDMNDVEKLYRPPGYGTENTGHAPDLKNRLYISSESLLK